MTPMEYNLLMLYLGGFVIALLGFIIYLWDRKSKQAKK